MKHMRTSFQVFTYIIVCAIGASAAYFGHNGVRANNADLRKQLEDTQAQVAKLSEELNLLRVEQVQTRRARLTHRAPAANVASAQEAAIEPRGRPTTLAAMNPTAASPDNASNATPPSSAAAPNIAPLSEEERVQQARASLADYLERTEGRSIGARMRQGRRLLEQLREMGDAGTLALLHTLEEGTSSRERQVAAALLGGMQDLDVALPVLNEIITSEADVMVRRGAARGLRIMDSYEAVPSLNRLAENPGEDRFVRYNAAIGLARLDEPQGVEHLVGIYNEASSSDGSGRYITFRALTRLDDPAALPAMRLAAGPENDISYRVGALKFIARHGTEDDVPLVQAALNEPSKQPAVLEAARDALRSLGVSE